MTQGRKTSKDWSILYAGCTTRAVKMKAFNKLSS